MDRRNDQRRLDQERLAQMRQAQQQAGAEASEDRGFVSEQSVQPTLKMTRERVQEAYHRLMRYKSGKTHLDARLVEVEQWWKIRHWEWMQERGAKDDMKTQSAWLFNVIISKHADGIQSRGQHSASGGERQGDGQAAVQHHPVRAGGKRL